MLLSVLQVGVTLPPFLTEGDFIQAPISSTVLIHHNLRGKQSNIVLKAHVSPAQQGLFVVT